MGGPKEEKKMRKIIKFLAVFAIAVAFVMMAGTPIKAYETPTDTGDIVFAEAAGIMDWFIGPDHTALWDDGNNEVIEADPHFEGWGDNPWKLSKMKWYYPFDNELLRKLTYESYADDGSEEWGQVESQSIGAAIWYEEAYSKCTYAHVDGGNNLLAINFARDRVGRPFDFVSPWYEGQNTKQLDTGSKEFFEYNNVLQDLGNGYYCSELTWAAWRHAGKYLDNFETNRVTPRELLWHSDVDDYETYWF